MGGGMAVLKRPRKCTWCKHPFLPQRMGQKVCSPECAWQLARKQREKVERVAARLRREALKSRSQWLREAQSAFNAWIRQRDQDLPCISCGRYGTKYDAGHYRSVGAAPQLRFNEDNVHKQCSQCNQHLSGNIVAYRQGLLQKIGPQRLDALEANHQSIRWTIEDARRIRDEYRSKLKEANG